MSFFSFQSVFTVETLVQWLNPPSLTVGDRGIELRSGIQVSKKQNVSSPLTQRLTLWGVREIASSASDRPGLIFEFCVWRAVSSHSSHHTQFS